ncbi:sigma factor [Kitasatospora sp. NPDC093679]|uniref:sigma factor n=1 Tax=Kitasatospora sp. NPDC093679 TaxID=3154983 RepID=UPI003425AA37
MSSSDERLALRLVRGEETALGELYDRFAPLVHGLALRVLDDQDAAEQLTRDVFAQVWTDPDRWHPEQGTLRSWLGRLTHRGAVARLREGCGDEHEIAARSAAAGAHHAVASLPDPLREAIAPGHHEGRTYRDTARRLGIGESAAKHRMRLGLQLVAGELAASHDVARDGRHGGVRGGVRGAVRTGSHADALDGARPEPVPEPVPAAGRPGP